MNKLPTDRVITKDQLPTQGEMVAVTSWSAPGEVVAVVVHGGQAEIHVQLPMRLGADVYRYYIKEQA